MSIRAEAGPTPGMRELTNGVRRLLVVASVLVFAAGVQLFVFTERTDRYFAWTIQVPLTAAFLGAGYWSSVLLEWLASRERLWARARIAVPGVFLFTILTLVATLLHLDLFHLDVRFPLPTRLVAWLWIGIYTFVPVAMLFLLVRQSRVAGQDPPRQRPFPRWMRIAIGLQGLIVLGVGGPLFVSPEEAASLWPWPLTPLTARAIGAWLLGMGAGMVQGYIENDLRRARVALTTYVAFGILQIAALARYPETPNWDAPAAWIYAAFLLSMIALGLYGTTRARGESLIGPSDTRAARAASHPNARK